MEVEAFLLCDAATDSQGKLNILGAFDTIFAPELPAQHPQCTVVARIRIGTEEAGRHNLILSMKDPSGEVLIPTFLTELNVSSVTKDQPARVNIIFNIQSLKLQTYGEHTVNLRVDNRDFPTLPFFVTRPGKPTSQSFRGEVPQL